MKRSLKEKWENARMVKRIEKSDKKLRKGIEERFNSEHWPTWGIIHAELASSSDVLPIVIYKPEEQFSSIKDYFDHNGFYKNRLFNGLNIMSLKSFTRDEKGWPSNEMETYYILPLKNKEELQNFTVPIISGSKQTFNYKELRRYFSKLYDEIENVPVINRNSFYISVKDILALPTNTKDGNIDFYYQDGIKFDGDPIDLAIMVNINFVGEDLLNSLNEIKELRWQSDAKIKEIKDAFEDKQAEKAEAVDDLYNSLK